MVVRVQKRAAGLDKVACYRLRRVQLIYARVGRHYDVSPRTGPLAIRMCKMVGGFLSK